jgi:prolyl-tRNA editing enzyme YbaK/EbsC (Cys-tRNA(Pro) deacylase)
MPARVKCGAPGRGGTVDQNQTGELSASAARVQRALADCGLELRVMEMPAATRTAAQAAAAVGCEVAQIAKSIVFRAPRSARHVLVVASGANRVDTAKVRTLLGEPLEKADAAFVREMTGYVIGGVPPLGHARQPVTFLDRDLLRHEAVWAAAGTPNALFRLTPGELERACGGTVADVAED